ncbi:hypothetical protein IMZ48_46930 [Candidatus Bathyarchaeota archaeon]|nr:hypothetical protein [Candidatus Bathyarchaeota archaeon]
MCCFSRPTPTTCALLSHSRVTTLFHGKFP